MSFHVTDGSGLRQHDAGAGQEGRKRVQRPPLDHPARHVLEAILLTGPPEPAHVRQRAKTEAFMVFDRDRSGFINVGTREDRWRSDFYTQMTSLGPAPFTEKAPLGKRRKGGHSALGEAVPRICVCVLGRSPGSATGTAE